MTARSILFVDDDERVLDGIRRSLHGLRREWDMAFASGGAPALELMAGRHFDVVVADMRMPGMDGAELLTAVKDRHPDTVRLILSGHADTASVMRAAGVAQQYLSKPCEPDVLAATVRRAIELQNLLGDPQLKQVIGRMDKLPSMPATYRDLLACLQSPDASLGDAARIVERDPAMTVKVLQLVNSAYFGLPRQLTSVERATSFLGLDTLTTLVLGHGIFSEFEGVETPGLNLQQLYGRTLQVARAARFIAQYRELGPKAEDQAFLAGMLQDLGTLVIGAKMPEEYGAIRARMAEAGLSRATAESELLGATHAGLGAYLVGLWGLPDTIVEAVLHHEEPSRQAENSLPLAGVVHLAERLVDHPQATDCPPDLDPDWTRSAECREACAEVLAAWRTHAAAEATA